jgi:D-serine deaminase-like pyridoxal phosphate-dependent protein
MTEVGMAKAELDTPALWIDMECMERNIAALSADLRRAGVNWRPHVKGIKTPAIAHRLIQAGAIGVTCAKLGEAEVMAAAGIYDILIANQVVGPQKLQRLVRLRRYADVKVAVDSVDNVREIGAAAVAAGVEIGLLVELDTGMKRAGTSPGEASLQVAQVIAGTPGTRFMGLMAWEGHNLSHEDLLMKRNGIEDSVGQLVSTAELCRAHGLDVPIVSGGGSGTYMVTAFIPGITEIQAGGAIFCDVSYQKWGVQLEPALYIQAMVTSRPAPDRVICDAGFKTMPRGFSTPRPVGLEVKSLLLSAEHGIITLSEANHHLKAGDKIDIMVGYGDATVFLHDTLYAVRNGVVEAVWTIQARGKLR